MTTTLTIPDSTLINGSHTFGPSAPANTETGFVLTLDRTVSAGLNSMTGTETILAEVDQSNDGGNTWQLRVSASMPGGVIDQGAGGSELTTSGVAEGLAPGTSRQLRVILTVAGPSAVAVSGTLVSA